MKIKYLTFIGLTLLSGFLFTQKVNAEIIKEQNYASNTEGPNNNFVQTLGTNIGGNFKSLTVIFDPGTVPQNFFFTIYATSSPLTSTTTIRNLITGGAGGVIVSATKSITSDISQTVTWTTSDVTSGTGIFTSNLNYVIYTGFGASGLSTYSISGTTEQFFTDGACYYYDTTGAGVITACDSLKDIFFILEIDNATAGTPTLTFPSNSSTVPDFGNWLVNYTGPKGTMHVRYGQNSSSLTNVDFQSFTTFKANQTVKIPKSKPLLNTDLTTEYQTWYAQPYYASGTNVTMGSIYTFTVNSQATTSVEYSEAEPTDQSINSIFNTTSTEQCDWGNIGGCFINAGNTLLKILFSPIGGIDQKVYDKFEDFQSVFPFSVPMTFFAQLETETATSTTQQDIQVPLPWATSTKINIFTSSTLVNFVGTTQKNNFFTAIETFIWLAVGFIMFKTVIHSQS